MEHILWSQNGDGIVARTPEEQEIAEHNGYVKCHTPDCPFMLSPETVERIKEGPGYYTCKRCKKSYHLTGVWPSYGHINMNAEVAQENYHADQADNPSFMTGGATLSGQTLKDHGQIGEDIVANMKEIPGFGPITWWHHGGASSSSPLDGETAEWGIEVKTIDVTAMNQRFIAGSRKRPRDDGEFYDEIASKEQAASEAGKQGIVGILVVVNYYTSTADVYAKDFPSDIQGKYKGFGHFYSHSAPHIIAKGVPFQNPLLDPHHPDPQQVKPIEPLEQPQGFGSGGSDIPW